MSSKKERKWMLHRIEHVYSNRSVPNLADIIEEDPRIKVYFPYLSSVLRVSTSPEINKSKWHHLKEEELLFYQEIDNIITTHRKDNDNDTSSISKPENNIKNPEINVLIDTICNDVINSYQKDKYTIKEHVKIKIAKTSETALLSNTEEHTFRFNAVGNPSSEITIIDLTQEQPSFLTRDSSIEVPDSFREEQYEKFDKLRNNYDQVKSSIQSIKVPTLPTNIDLPASNIEEKLKHQSLQNSGSDRTENYLKASTSSLLEEENICVEEIYSGRSIEETLKRIEFKSELLRKRLRNVISKSKSPSRRYRNISTKSQSQSHSLKCNKTEIIGLESQLKLSYSVLERSSPCKIEIKHRKTQSSDPKENSFPKASTLSSLEEENRKTSSGRKTIEQLKMIESESKLLRKRLRHVISKNKSSPRKYRKNASRSHSLEFNKTEIIGIKSDLKFSYSGLQNQWRRSPCRVETNHRKTQDFDLTEKSFPKASTSSSLDEENLFVRETSSGRNIDEKLRKIESESKLLRKRLRSVVSKSKSSSVHQKIRKTSLGSHSRSHSLELSTQRLSKSPNSGLDNQSRSSSCRIKTKQIKTCSRNKSTLSPDRTNNDNNLLFSKSKAILSPDTKSCKHKDNLKSIKKIDGTRWDNTDDSKQREITIDYVESNYQHEFNLQNIYKIKQLPFTNIQVGKMYPPTTTITISTDLSDQETEQLNLINSWKLSQNYQQPIATNEVTEICSSTSITSSGTIVTSENQQMEQLNLLNSFKTDKHYLKNNLWKSQRNKKHYTKHHQVIFCEVCKIFVNTKSQYDIHVNGKVHQKKVQLLEVFETMNRQLQYLSSPCPLQTTPLENLRCDIDAYNSHMMSMNYTQNLTMISEINMFNQNKDTENITVESVQNDSEQVLMNEEAEVEFKKKRVVAKHCTVCNITVNSVKSYEMHLNSKRHKKKLTSKDDWFKKYI